MSLFNQDEKILCRIGEPKTSYGKGVLKQIIPCVFVVPERVALQQLDVRLEEWLSRLSTMMVNPHVQGTPPVEDEDEPQKYRAVIWLASDDPNEQKELYKKPVAELEDVTLGRFTAYPSGEYDGSIMVTQQITAPFRSESLAGKIDKLAGLAVRMQISELQTKLELQEGGES